MRDSPAGSTSPGTGILMEIACNPHLQENNRFTLQLHWSCPGGSVAQRAGSSFTWCGAQLPCPHPPVPSEGDISFCSPTQAVYQCPEQVWHVELLPQPWQLYILCAHSGIYCVSLEQQSR